MLKIKHVKCEKCGKLFKKEMGGIVKGADDYCNICPTCKEKKVKINLK